jgi:hypothetical protein
MAGLACVQPQNYTLQKILFLLPAFQTSQRAVQLPAVVAQNHI